MGKSVFTNRHDFGLTAGINQGYLTGGVFLDLYLFRIDIANYGVETGYAPGQELERRWVDSCASYLF